MTTLNQLMIESTATINGAYAKFANRSPLGNTGKREMCTFLAEGIKRGAFTMSDVLATPPIITTGIQATIQGTAIESVANKANDLALEGLQKINSLNAKLIDVNQALGNQATAINELTSKLNVMGSIDLDQSLINAKVHQLIEDSFKPFKQAIEDKGAQAIVANLNPVIKIDRKPCSEVFGVDLPLDFDIYNDPSAPSIDPHFIWTEDILRSLAFSQDTGANLWFGGEKGTGKSQTAEQFSARTGRGFMRYNFHKYTTASDYLGDVGLENGATVFKQGDFLRAYTAPSTVILLDEITNADQGELAPLNGFLEPNAKVTYGGQLWSRADGVIVIGADNTLMNGDVSGRYAGTRTTNSALADRFSAVIKFQHLPIEVECNAVMNHTGACEELVMHVLHAVHACRAKVQSGDIIDAPSIRQVIAFIRLVKYHSVGVAWEMAIQNRQPDESSIALTGMFQAYIDPSKIDSLTRGSK